MSARVLIIESTPQRAKELGHQLSAMGAQVQYASNATQGWKSFAKYRPTHVFAALCCEEDNQGGEQFLRKLESDYVGTMPKVYLCGSLQELAESRPTKPSAYIIWPISQQSLAAILRTSVTKEVHRSQQVSQLRELYKMSLLGSDLIRELDFVVSRAALAFQVSGCIFWGPSNEPHWPRSSFHMSDAEWQVLQEQCDLAIHAGTTIIVSQGSPSETTSSKPGKSLLATALGPADGAPFAGLCLISNDSHEFSHQIQDSIRILAQRLSAELAWMSAHNRLVDEYEKLRQAALIDPLLGVWTRPALKKAFTDQILASQSKDTPLAMVIFDYIGLRNINDRFGHVTGDAVLKHLAEVLGESLRAHDQLGRFDGDKLAALLVGAKPEECLSIATSIVQRVANASFVDEGKEIQIKIRAGITIVHADETSSETALARANQALFLAKKQAKPVLFSAASSASSPQLNSEQAGLLPAGATLGGMYRILHEISRGSMGVVYRGIDLGLGRPVAIKLLRSHVSESHELVEEFRAEATLLASLRHRNLVQVFSFGTEHNVVYFVMELVEGQPLSQFIWQAHEDKQFVDLALVSKFVTEIADALDAIHRLGIVHRDVKPENILIDRINNRAILVDVGIAKRKGDTRDAAGTPGYAAPESFMETEESPPTDVYGLAATTYAVLTGAPPYQGDDLTTVVSKQLNEPFVPVQHLRPDFTPDIDHILTMALAPKAKHRYRSAGAFAIALQNALRKQPRPANTSSWHSDKDAPNQPPMPKGISTQRNISISTNRLATPLLSNNTHDTLRREASTQTFRASLSRGAIFNAIGEVAQNKCDNEWFRTLEKEEPQLATLLSPTTLPLSWQPTEHLTRLLALLDTDTHFHLQPLGESIASTTLAKLYAIPENSTPASLLKAAPFYWERYHTWGQLSVHPNHDTAVQIQIENGSCSALLCRMLSGMFQQIPMIAGASSATCTIVSCQAKQDSHCSFAVQWSLPPVIAP